MTNYVQFLNYQELEQWQKLFFNKYKYQYWVTRMLVRDVLSRYLQGIPAENIEFKTNNYKKPYSYIVSEIKRYTGNNKNHFILMRIFITWKYS
ncbi:hypothetical protein BGI08_03460 [Snodgrassella alvi]|nr:hypothetical protein BGI08_03460 [Snodgrassella alvi]ORF30521.1 hypothetical protein BGI09_07670 [Snodgrassella alvi]PIT30890.1 hypothetical protein BHC50_10460 [Snodgrassella alvi]PIT32181.1 hypothetical protein BHC42_09945 [Snodgrassella alvi]